jgi:hypothetical protein
VTQKQQEKPRDFDKKLAVNRHKPAENPINPVNLE